MTCVIRVRPPEQGSLRGGDSIVRLVFHRLKVGEVSLRTLSLIDWNPFQRRDRTLHSLKLKQIRVC